jgi:hypothetical protein
MRVRFDDRFELIVQRLGDGHVVLRMPLQLDSRGNVTEGMRLGAVAFLDMSSGNGLDVLADVVRIPVMRPFKARRTAPHPPVWSGYRRQAYVVGVGRNQEQVSLQCCQVPVD